MDYSCKFLMGKTASMVVMDCVRPLEEGRGGPVFVQHSNTHTASLRTHAVASGSDLKYLRSSGTHPSIEEQFCVQTPAVVFHDSVSVSKETPVGGERGQQQQQQQQPRPHGAQNEP